MKCKIRPVKSSTKRANSDGVNRRAFIRTAGLTAAAMAMPGCDSTFARHAAGESKSKPNIILIMADDLGYECLGCYGSTSYKTPALDHLAGTGVRFEHCYSQPLCTPSRVKIMTGQYNFRNYTEFGVLDPEQKTFGHLMQSCRYATCVVGKWQLYGSVNQREKVRGTGSLPDQAGFDEHCLWQISQRGPRYRDPMIIQNGKLREDLKGRYGPDVFCDYALDFIERHRAKAFFVYFPMTLVHSPFVPTPDSRDWTKNVHKNNKKYFADMVAYMDKIAGRIVRKLDELGLRDSTLILFTGDNGTSKGIKSRLGDRIIKGGKGDTTDAGTHVPLIANWKGTTPAGKVCRDLIGFTDFVPTLAELTGTSALVGMVIDGHSFLPQIRGQKGKPRDWIFCHYNPKWGKWKLKRFARDKRWKLYANGQLFDVQAYPLEASPVMPGQGGAEAAAAKKRLQAILDSMK